MSRPRIAIVASHPVQYQVPWYRAIARRADLQVFFAHRVTPAQQAQAGFGVAFDWDVPLLDGYQHEWLPNVAARPGVDHFRGCNTPAIADRIASGGFDGVVVNGWQLLSYWQAVRAARRCRVPVFVRGDSQLRTGRKAIGALKRIAYPTLLKAFDGFLAVGERNREYYRHYGVHADRVWSAPHCVDNAFFAASAAAARGGAAHPRRRFDLQPAATVFLLAARLIEMKRPLDFVRALDKAHAAGANVQGLIVGDGPLRGVLEDEVRRTGAPCAIAGFLNQQQIGTAFAAADALVLTSDGRETWGLIVNEAMAAGLPAFVSDAAGCSPDLIVNGDTGRVFPCGDVDALGRCLYESAENNLLARLGRAAAARIEAYAPERTADGVIAAVSDTLQRGAKFRHEHPQHASA